MKLILNHVYIRKNQVLIYCIIFKYYCFLSTNTSDIKNSIPHVPNHNYPFNLFKFGFTKTFHLSYEFHLYITDIP